MHTVCPARLQLILQTQPVTSLSYSSIYTGIANCFGPLTLFAATTASSPPELHCIAPSGDLFWTA